MAASFPAVKIPLPSRWSFLRRQPKPPLRQSGQRKRNYQSEHSAGNVEYFLGDALGSVRQLVDEDGTVTLAQLID